MRCCVCLRTNHRAENCKVIRFPTPGKYCHHCKIPAHTYAECRRKNYAKHHANLIRDESDANQNDQPSENWDYWDVEDPVDWSKLKLVEKDSSNDDQTSSEDDQ